MQGIRQFSFGAFRQILGVFLLCATNSRFLPIGWSTVSATDTSGINTLQNPSNLILSRGGAAVTSRTNKADEDSAFPSLAAFISKDKEFQDVSLDKLTKTLERMAAAQQTFKGLDGAAHEAYQRTRAAEDIDTSVSGRAQRSAARLAATAEGLLACELVEMVEQSSLVCDESLNGREVILNITTKDSEIKLGKFKLTVLILYEPTYDGGAGLNHGNILSLVDHENWTGPKKGRLLVVLGDNMSEDLIQVLSLMNQKPKRIKLSSGLVNEEVASVHPSLYKAAGELLNTIEPQLRQYNTTAVHFVGRSLAGGVASLAATMLDGSLPLPKKKFERKKIEESFDTIEVKTNDSPASDSTDSNTTVTQIEIVPLSGLGRARSSAMTLGAPPCLSSNVLAAFCTSFLYGDDVVVRGTRESFDRLHDRVKRNLKGGVVGRNLGWVSDTVSLTFSSLQSHAHGSEGEEAKLSVPGRAYLVRPRRLGGICSIHEVGNLKKGGREAFRANLLWQLHDILLSKSMWKHHSLNSYINGLDRVQLRGNTHDQDEESLY